MKYLFITLGHIFKLITYSIIAFLLIFIGFIWHLKITESMEELFDDLIKCYKEKIIY